MLTIFPPLSKWREEKLCFNIYIYIYIYIYIWRLTPLPPAPQFRCLDRSISCSFWLTSPLCVCNDSRRVILERGSFINWWLDWLMGRLIHWYWLLRRRTDSHPNLMDWCNSKWQGNRTKNHSKKVHKSINNFEKMVNIKVQRGSGKVLERFGESWEGVWWHPSKKHRNKNKHGKSFGGFWGPFEASGRPNGGPRGHLGLILGVLESIWGVSG